MLKLPVRLGFVPSLRFRYTDWVQKMRAESLAAFSRLDEVQIIVPGPSPDGITLDEKMGLTPYGMVQNLDQAEVVVSYFRQQKIDGLILCPLDFGDERSAVKIAESMGVPVLLYATKEPPANTDASMGRVSDSYCGNLSMASGLYRRKIAFHYAGLFFPDEPELARIVQDFAKSVSVVKNLRGAQIGQIGVRPATFETVGFNEVAMIKKFNQNVIVRDLSEIVLRAQKLPDQDERVNMVIEAIRSDVPIITVDNSYLVKEAKMEVAIKEFWQQAHLSALAMSCWPSIQSLFEFSTCGLFGRLTGQGLLTACETDILGAVSMLVSYAAGLAKTPPHFVDWTIQHRENPNRLLAWHCGNAPYALARNPAEVALRSRHDMQGSLPIPVQDSQAGLFQFQLKPGPVTFCRLAEYDGDWKMLIAPGEIIPSDEILAGTWSWVEVSNHERLYRTLVEEGFIHHASMIHGDQLKPLELACKYLDIKPVIVV